MLHNSLNSLVKNTKPSIITSQKWKVKIAVENAGLALKMKEISGAVANRRAGCGLHPQRWLSKESKINKRKMVSEEIHHIEEVRL